MKTSSTPARFGFTLVELLVTLGVIGLLAALLLPGLLKAKALALSTQCRNNLRQFGLATALYVTDQLEYPRWEMFDEAGPRFWNDLLDPYLNAKWTNQIFRCPGNFKQQSNRAFVAADFSGRQVTRSRGDYDLNAHGAGGNLGIGEAFELSSSGETALRAVREGEVVSPAQMLAIGDSVLPANGVLSRFGWAAYYFPGSDEDKRTQKKRHNGKFNVVFCDTHVEFCKTNELFRISDDRIRQWNRDYEAHPEKWRSLSRWR